MIEFSEIQEQYASMLHERGEALLREYLQYKLLQIIYESPFGHQLVFLGGTCVHLVYGSERFSEDLDFDNQGLTEADFIALAQRIEYQLGLHGYTVRTRTLNKGAFHCYIRFPGILYHYGLSGHREAKILIKLYAEQQRFPYEPAIHTLRKFDVRCALKVTPPDLLLSQKIAAAVGRKRPKGRDFYDIRFLLQRTPPHYGYLENRFEVATPEALRSYLSRATADFDFAGLAADVSPFLFRTGDSEWVRTFPEFWRTVRLAG